MTSDSLFYMKAGSMAMADRKNILGVTFDDVTPDEALERVQELIKSRTPGYIVTPNAEFVYTACKDERIRTLLNGAALVVPDGIGVLYASKILGRGLRGRVPGVELGERLAEICAQKDYTLYLLGAKPGVAEKAGKCLTLKYPKLRIVGTHDGYFKDDAPVVEELRKASPDVIFVCLGFPRQERFMREHLAQLPPAVMLGLGGSMDVYAGTVKRAPVFWQKLGLEWFYRLCCEPKRIKRMIKLPAFLFTAIGARLRHREDIV